MDDQTRQLIHSAVKQASDMVGGTPEDRAAYCAALESTLAGVGIASDAPDCVVTVARFVGYPTRVIVEEAIQASTGGVSLRCRTVDGNKMVFIAPESVVEQGKLSRIVDRLGVAE